MFNQIIQKQDFETLKAKKKELLTGFKEYNYIIESPAEMKTFSYEPKIKLPDIFKNNAKVNPNAILVPNMPIYTATVMGHVDHGKSTLLGRLLLLCGRVKSHVIDTYREEAKLNQKATFEFAWVLDSTAVERQKGVTIDNSFKEFNTEDRYFTMIDAPGHKDYLKNSLNAIMQADLAILAIDVKKGLDEKSNARQHLLAARASGVNSMVVALTKMDTVPLEERAVAYMQRVSEIRDYLNKMLRWNPERVTFVPVNSLKDPGWNIINSTPEELPFYCGPTLVQALNEIPMDPVRSDLDFRLAVDEVLTGVPGTNVVATGKVLSGEVRPGDKVILNPGTHTAVVRTVTMHHQEISVGATNSSVGVDLVNINANAIKRGAIIASIKNPAKTIKELTCEKLWLIHHPTKLCVNSKVIGHYLTGHVTLTVKSISNVTNDKGIFTAGEVKELEKGSLAKVIFEPEKPIVMEPVTTNPKMGNLVIRDQGINLGIAKVTEVKEAF